MELETRKEPESAVPSNGTNGNGNGNGHGGIAVPAVEALGTPEASQPVVVVVETTEAGGQGASADSESVDVPENESGGAEAATNNEGEEAPRSNDEQLPKQLQDGDLVVFRPWRVGPVVSMIVAVDLTKALAERPDRKWSERIRDSYGPAKQLLDSVGEEEVKSRLRNIVRSGEDGHRFTFAQAKVVVYKFLYRIAYAILPGVELKLRETLLRRMQVIDEERGWFCPGAQFDEELAGYRRWQEEQQRRAATEHRARETARGTEEMLGAMSLLGGEVAIRVPSVAGASERQTIGVGDRIAGVVKGLAIGTDKRENRRYVAGILFQIENGLESFVPVSETGWSRTGESEDEFGEAMRKNFPSGKTERLEVVKVEPDKKKGGIRIVARILDLSEIVSNDDERQSRPGLRLGEEVGGVVRWGGRDGVTVRLFAPDIELFASAGDLAPDTALGDYRRGDRVEGIVIQGDRKPYALRITVREEGKGKGEQPAPEHIIHPERAEKIRSFATSRGLDLGERWNTLREYADRANRLGTLKLEEVEPARAFFGEILKDVADVPAEISEAAAGVVTTRGAYREEQESKRRKLDGQGAAEDNRPFCKKHDASNGQRCDKHVEKVGDLCDRCTGKERRMSAKAPKQPKAKAQKQSNCKACIKEGGPCKKHRRQAAA